MEKAVATKSPTKMQAAIEALQKAVGLDATISLMVRVTGDLDIEYTDSCGGCHWFESSKTGQVYKIQTPGLFYKVGKGDRLYLIKEDGSSRAIKGPCIPTQRFEKW